MDAPGQLGQAGSLLAVSTCSAMSQPEAEPESQSQPFETTSRNSATASCPFDAIEIPDLVLGEMEQDLEMHQAKCAAATAATDEQLEDLPCRTSSGRRSARVSASTAAVFSVATQSCEEPTQMVVAVHDVAATAAAAVTLAALSTSTISASTGSTLDSNNYDGFAHEQYAPPVMKTAMVPVRSREDLNKVSGHSHPVMPRLPRVSLPRSPAPVTSKYVAAEALPPPPPPRPCHRVHGRGLRNSGHSDQRQLQKEMRNSQKESEKNQNQRQQQQQQQQLQQQQNQIQQQQNQEQHHHHHHHHYAPNVTPFSRNDLAKNPNLTTLQTAQAVPMRIVHTTSMESTNSQNDEQEISPSTCISAITIQDGEHSAPAVDSQQDLPEKTGPGVHARERQEDVEMARDDRAAPEPKNNDNRKLPVPPKERQQQQVAVGGNLRNTRLWLILLLIGILLIVIVAIAAGVLVSSSSSHNKSSTQQDTTAPTVPTLQMTNEPSPSITEAPTSVAKPSSDSQAPAIPSISTNSPSESDTTDPPESESTDPPELADYQVTPLPLPALPETPATGPPEVDLVTTSPPSVVTIPEPSTVYAMDLPQSSQMALSDPKSPQSAAYDWLVQHPQLKSLPEWKKQQLFALATFFYAFHGNNWIIYERKNWLNYEVAECQWGDLGSSANTCDEEGRFLELSIEGSEGFVGSILPPEITLLSSLQALKLYSLELQADIADIVPSYLKALSNLNTIILHSNKLNGSLPTYLADLTSLQNINLRSNRISGALPSELGLLTNLKYLTLYENLNLAGTLPTELGLITTLESMLVDRTSITGEIPTTICSLPKLSSVRVNCEMVICRPEQCPCSCYRQ